MQSLRCLHQSEMLKRLATMVVQALSSLTCLMVETRFVIFQSHSLGNSSSVDSLPSLSLLLRIDRF